MGLSRLIGLGWRGDRPRFRRLPVLPLVLAAAALAGAGWEALQWRRAQHWNAVIASGRLDSGVEIDTQDLPPQVQFAQAAALAASGATEAALNRYQALQDDPVLGGPARYNSANLLLRQAIRLQAGPLPGQAIPLIELAKENYREVLRRDPSQWSARYNLERAQRLLPEAEDDERAAAVAPQSAERAATTMRGFSLGLP